MLFRSPVTFLEHLDSRSALKDRIMMGLRLGEGVDLGEIEDRFSVNLMSGELESLIGDQFVELMGNRIRLSKKGVLVSNSIIYKIIDAVAS